MVRFFLKSYLVSTCLTAIFAISFGASLAQGVSTVEISANPANPEPNENVSIDLSSTSIDLSSTNIYWYVDDVLRKQGVGEDTLNIQSKGSGKTTAIRANVKTSDSQEFTKNLIISPARVDLVVEASSYVPPFYKGQAYFVNQGVAKVIAVPDITVNGKKMSASSLNYRWSQDGIVLGDSSGLGRNTLIVNGNVPIKDLYVEVKVLDQNSKSLAEKAVSISPSDPRVIFYENSALYGELLNKAITKDYFLGTREELKVTAEPCFFDISGNIGNDSKYTWYVNGQNPVTTGGNKNELILKQENGGVKGVASISLQIENLARIFQYAGNSFNVEFGQ